MPPDCAAELRASEKHSTIGLLAREVCGVSNIVKIEDYSELNHAVLRFYRLIIASYKEKGHEWSTWGVLDFVL